MNELAKESWNYTLSENESGNLIFSVLSGSIGLYEIVIQLTTDETARYRKEGKAYLTTLADEMRTHESRFESRKIS